MLYSLYSRKLYLLLKKEKFIKEKYEYEEIVNEYKLMVKIVNKNLVKELGITYDELGKKCTKLEKECAYRLISLMRK